jgi:hypothetical protein
MGLKKFVIGLFLFFIPFMLLMNACTLNKTTDEAKMSPVQERALIRWQMIPKKVLAFYYPWYGTPELSGIWNHYDGVDLRRKTIANFTHYPSMGPFDSNDPGVVDRHMQIAKSAGIDGFIISWWGQGSFEDKAMPLILSKAAKYGIEIAVCYETISKPICPENAAADLLYILNTYGSHKAFQKLNGKPVVFIYARAIKQLKQVEWAGVLNDVNRIFKRGFVSIGHGFSRNWAMIFDGIHIYNYAGKLSGKPLKQAINDLIRLYGYAIALTESFEKLLAVTVIPGYDDTKIRYPGLKVERLDGELYKRMWEMAIDLNPDWVLITSFNE